jgi:very-short-patch-repair endonuclease
MFNNYYNKKLKGFARNHRNHSTKAEIRLWCELLRKKKMLGYQFLRQRPIGKYIADFFCKELKLVIETDGYTHFFPDVIEKDKRKTGDLENLGYSLLRFRDEEVMDEIDKVRRKIEHWIKSHYPVQP